MPLGYLSFHAFVRPHSFLTLLKAMVMRVFLTLFTVAACGQPAGETSQPTASASAPDDLSILPPQVREWIGRDTPVFKGNPDPHVVAYQLVRLCVGSSNSVSTASADPNAKAYVDVYLNDLADANLRQAVTRDTNGEREPRVPFPQGAVLLKHKTGLARTLQGQLIEDRAQEGWGGMLKGAAGSSPATGDWSYFYYSEADGLSSGPGMNCVTCHAAYDQDFQVLGYWHPTRASDAQQNSSSIGSTPHSWLLPEPSANDPAPGSALEQR